MARRATLYQAELKRYLCALREAGYLGGTIVLERPDGTRISIVAGQTSDESDEEQIDRIIGNLP